MKNIEEMWLNFFLRFSGFVFEVKQKMVKAKNWRSAAYNAVILVVSELGFVVISLPLYLIVSPAKLQEEGLVFPKKEEDRTHYQGFVIRRRVSIATIVSAIGIWIVKLSFFGATSFYLLGAQSLLAISQDWTFDMPSDYTYDAAKIEVAGGSAKLVDQGTGGSCTGTASACSIFSSSPTCIAQGGCAWGASASGATTNPSFDLNATGWTYADWLQPTQATAQGTYRSSGGNPGGYVDLNLTTTKKNKTIAGYWRQSFTTTVAAPDTATLNFNWRSFTYTSPSAPVTYKLYAFIDTGSGVPTLGQEVWSSSEITGATSWASVATIDIKSKILTAGTYYLKIAAYVTTPNTDRTFEYISNFDNVQLNWSKTGACSGTPTACTTFTHSTCSGQSGCAWATVPVYPSNKPSIYPNVSFAPPSVTYWNSFTETATKNSGEIYYQLSNDDGSTWKYWDGLAWATATTSTNSNTALAINTNIRTFDASTGKIKWKAYLASNGSQQISLDNVSVGYLQNSAPSVQNLTAAQDATHGYVVINYNLTDAQSDPSSLVNYEYSLTGAFVGEQVTMTPVSGDPAHSGVDGLSSSPAGTAHSFVWDAQSDLGDIYTNTVYVRLRPNDGIVNGDLVSSGVFAVDYVAPLVSGLTAVQATGTTDVVIGYNLFDNTNDNIVVELQVSSDGGSTWNVPVATVSGDIGSALSVGNGKSITWKAGTDFSGHELNSMKVRVRAKDKYENQSVYVSSADFALDNSPPVVATTADLTTQPMAGTTVVLVGGSFTERNPNTNSFYVAVDNGSYGAATLGDADTATPSDKSVEAGRVLKGTDFVSAVKIEHVDDFGQTTVNENTSPKEAYKYVKPYTPSPPTVNNETAESIDVTINKNPDEADGLEYAIFESTHSKFVQSDGSFGASPEWRGLGKIKVTDVAQPISQYVFKVKSRNVNDAGHAATSESEYSSGASSVYQSPQVAINSAAQTTDGSKIVTINYTGIDSNNQVNSLVAYEYSVDGTTWHTMTEKVGPPSNGTTALPFNASGASLSFVWDVGMDLPSVEDAAVTVRLTSNDAISNSNTAVSSAFAINTASPIVSAIQAEQLLGTDNVTIKYDLSESSGTDNAVEILISDDGGANYAVAAPSVAGDIGSAVMAGASRTINWNVGTDLPGQEKSNMRVKIRAKDSFGNQGDYVESADFKIDTKAPVVSGVVAEQLPGSALVTVNYTLSDLSDCDVVFDVSSDSGSTWTVATTTHSGDIGLAQTSGAKTFTWNVVVDLPGQSLSAMRVRVQATDVFAHGGTYELSSDFAVNTTVLSISNISAAQNIGAKTVAIRYNLNKTATIEAGISSDGGITWNVATTTLAGSVGENISAGHNKSITWNPGVEFNGQENSTMRVRIRGTDSLGATSEYYESMDFSVDTAAPVGLTSFRKFSSTSDSATLNWSSGVSDAHFNHYELWHGATENDVAARTGTATKWSVTQDSSLVDLSTISTVITGIALTRDYYVKIWAIDDYGNETTLDDVNVFVPPEPTFDLSIELPEGSGSSTPAAGTYTYNQGTNASILATASLGWIFNHWLLDVSSTISTNPLTVAMSSNHTVKPVFTEFVPPPPTQKTLTISASVGGTTDPAIGAHNYNTNSTITITETPNSGYNFVRWEKDGVPLSTAKSVNIVLADNTSVSAIFEAITVTPVETALPAVSGGGSGTPVSATLPGKPVLTRMESPTRNSKITISGLADSGSYLDLFDNNSFVTRLAEVADKNGQFTQTIIFAPGEHVLTVKASDVNGNVSVSSDPVNLSIVVSNPSAPIILSPTRDQGTIEATPLIVGVADPNSQLNLLLDDKTTLTAKADANGAWQIKIPSTFALSDGAHTLKVQGTDEAGNKSLETNLTFNKVALPKPVAVTQPAPTTAPRTPATSQTPAAPAVPAAVSRPAAGTPVAPVAQIIPTPPASLIRENTQAVALPGIAAPKIVSAAVVANNNNVFTFKGTALPNQEVVVYVHSQQALVYRTRADSSGNWTVDHSQDVVELEPGEHTVFAVAVDPAANVKSLPSAVNSFTVQRNWLAYALEYLNWQTSLATLAVLMAALYWLNKVKRTSRMRI